MAMPSSTSSGGLLLILLLCVLCASCSNTIGSSSSSNSSSNGGGRSPWSETYDRDSVAVSVSVSVAAAAATATAPPCQCANTTFCKPIVRDPSAPEKVYAFHVARHKMGSSTTLSSTPPLPPPVWPYYDWSQITTICVFGEVDPQLLCHAHEWGARVTLGVSVPHDAPSIWVNNASAVDAWANSVLNRVVAARADGVNLDIEVVAKAGAQADAITRAVSVVAALIRTHNPYAHVTLDAPSEGYGADNGIDDVHMVAELYSNGGIVGSKDLKLERLNLEEEEKVIIKDGYNSKKTMDKDTSAYPATTAAAPATTTAAPGPTTLKQTPKAAAAAASSPAVVVASSPSQCGTMYGRAYNFSALADLVDFFVVMDYDSARPLEAIPRTRAFLGGPGPGAGNVYIYPTRQSAHNACVQAGWPRLCTRAELKGYSNCARGWCSDWEGFWMDSNVTGCGYAGYNPRSPPYPPRPPPPPTPGGAYCCGSVRPPCSTCFMANAALPVVRAGVACFVDKLGISASKLVLAFPWYGYKRPCATAASNGNGAADRDGHGASVPELQKTKRKSKIYNNNNGGDDDPTKGGPCRVVGGAVSMGYPEIAAILARGAAAGVIGGRQWAKNASAPYIIINSTGSASAAAAAAAAVASTRGTVAHTHSSDSSNSRSQAGVFRIDYDDSQSLRLKYAYALQAGARGVGMWHASLLNYSDTATTQRFWNDLKVFSGGPRRAFSTLEAGAATAKAAESS